MRPLALLSLLCACAAPAAEPDCLANADCASNLCEAGRCAPYVADAGADAGVDAGLPDAGPADLDAGPATDGGHAGCVPDHDGAFERAEFPLRAGMSGVFRTATDVDVDTDGTALEGGRRRWDLSGALPGDHPLTVSALAPEGQWWADSFTDASYAARLADGSDLLGVFRLRDDALALLGVVSPEDGLFVTKLTYDPPVKVLAFPVKAGDTWLVDAVVTGFAQGVWMAYTENYQFRADLRGELLTPFGTFPVQRVRQRLTRTVGFAVIDVRSHAFVTECYGTVATMTSPDYETRDEFPEAAEVKRLAP